MKWCDCSHCIRRRFWEGWAPSCFVGHIVIGTFQIFTDNYFIGVPAVAVNVFVLWMTYLRKQRFIIEDHVCKVELAVQMLQGEDDVELDWGRLMTGRPVQPPPGKVLKCGTVMK